MMEEPKHSRGHVARAAVRAGAGMLVRHLPGQSIVEPVHVPRRGGSVWVPPFYARKAGVDGDDYLVRVLDGTVNDLSPDTVGGVEDWVFAIGEDEERKIYLEAHLTAEGLVDEALLKITADGDDTPETPAGNGGTGAPPAATYRTVAHVVRAGAAAPVITNFLSGSQWVSVVVAFWSCTTIVRNITWR